MTLTQIDKHELCFCVDMSVKGDGSHVSQEYRRGQPGSKRASNKTGACVVISR